MSWTEDIILELKELDSSPKNLRKFAFLVGGIALVLAFWLLFRHFSPLAYCLLGITGIFLIAMGIFLPRGIKGIYRLWMGMAFAIGWVVSRIVLVIIFYFVVMSVGLAGRFFGKEFLDIKVREGKDSYWIKRDKGKKADYEKMY